MGEAKNSNNSTYGLEYISRELEPYMYEENKTEKRKKIDKKKGEGGDENTIANVCGGQHLGSNALYRQSRCQEQRKP